MGLLLSLALFVTCGSPSEAHPPQEPSAPCLHATYSISWNGLPVGKAKLKCRRFGQEVLVQLQGRSVAALNAVYPLKLKVDSRLRADGTQPLQYQEKTQEGRKKNKTKQIVFAPEQNAVKVFKNGRLRRTLEVPQGTVDPLGAVYRFLSASFDAMQTRGITVTDGKRVFELHMTPLGEESVQTPWGARTAELWQASARVLAGKPHALEQVTLHAWTLSSRPATLVKATVRFRFGAFSAQIEKSEAFEDVG
ncbi:uncharacterized protein DUF3108 [Desulfosoma caldarium]|uniref:Uncharacterized protein DUF3108 n=1 Tax=Desulfosoma caldarium TaxID=610254 RepID=A0A3N1UMD8_9BACT|nr:uncharacterized protein DUF3108 [Desulfosoma caldarium]